MSTIETNLPNYRIYDRTGGGDRQDIYAASLDDAIEAGRDWIKDGDWSGLKSGTSLDCCVREIVRVPDLRSIDALTGVADVAIEDDVIIADVRMECVDMSGKTLGARMARVGEPDEDGYARYAVCLAGPVPMMIDDIATDHGQSWDCSGSVK